MPVVDIIIPAYNAAAYLSLTIESVIAQTFQDWRIVLVDDGSTDETASIAAAYSASLGDKFLLISQQNRGLPSARNAAMRASSAEFLALLDADDLWLPHRLAASLAPFQEHPEIGLTYGLITRIDAKGKLLDTFKGNPVDAQGRIAPALYKRTVELPCPTITFRRSCIAAVGGFDESMRASEDRDLWFRIALRYEVAVVSEVIASYRIYPGSMSADADRMLRAQLRFIRKHYGSPGCGFFARQSAMARAYKQRADTLKGQAKPSAAIVSSLHAVLLCPMDPSNIRTAASLLLCVLRSSSKR
ncbi:Glycosyl transferase family 2 [Granulicella pectinivorans]|uniref:Glycosyl transferase family 2 n=1 Tax=Granulicella pectinivorans TaxID=474950 RepID=A0A1I6MLY9_9BACT|nr:glycosyltransferase family A protein [Granulicella pectinivorans]SFS16746.1 Glycosyl transferase family 2 [Granulicella pectinivorans]